MQLHQPPVLKALDNSDAQLIVVSFAPLERLQSWVPFLVDHLIARSYAEQGFVLPPEPLARTRFLADPERTAYHAYGLGRNSRLRVYGPSILWQYLRWGMQGKRIPSTPDDVLQRGGDFVVGRDGRLTLAHVGRDQRNRPAVDQIIVALGKT